MSVPAALTAILTMGPAYGLQLHSELGARLPHRQATNVGQIYSTLERLVRDGFVQRAGETEDGLPLYQITLIGKTSAMAWLSGEDITRASPWTEVLDVLLAASTIPQAPVELACTVCEDIFSQKTSLLEGLSASADENFAQAVLATVTDVRRAVASGLTPQRGYDTARPVRGRRPGALKG